MRDRIIFVKCERGSRMRALYLVHYGYPPFSAGWFTFSDVSHVPPGRAFGSGKPSACLGQARGWPQANVRCAIDDDAPGGGSLL